MAKSLHVAILVVLILTIIGIFVFPYLKSFSRPSIELSVSKNPVSPGFVDIIVKSNTPLKKATIRVGTRQAVFVSSTDNTYIYQYFVSPYTERDPIGTTQVFVEAVDVYGNYLNATTKLNISYFAIGDRVDGVIYYYLAAPPTKENPTMNYTKPTELVRSIVFNGNVSFFFELDEGRSKRNSEIINAFQPLIIELTSVGINVSSYAVEIRNGKWVNCLDTNGDVVPVSKCKETAFTTPSIVLKLPIYPTTQVVLTNTTIELQPAIKSTKVAINSLISLLGLRSRIFRTNTSTQ